MTLPKLSKKERINAINNRLGTLYPGTINDKILVCLKNGAANKSTLVFLFNNSLKNNPLMLSTLVVCRMFTTGKHYVIFSGSTWLEYLILEDGELLFSSVVNRGGTQLSEIIYTSALDTFGENCLKIDVLCKANEITDSENISEVTIEYFAFEDFFTSISRSKISCYPGLLNEIKTRNFVFSIFLFILLGVAGTFTFRFLEERNEIQKELKQEQLRKEVLEKNEKQGLEMLAALENEYAVLLSERSEPIYGVFEVLSSSLNPDIRVISVGIADNNFNMEAVSSNPLFGVKKLLAHPQVREMEIQTLTVENNYDRISLKGIIIPKPPESEHFETMKSKIEWYEKQISSYKNHRTEKKVENIAAAGEMARKIFNETGCTLKNIRYTDVDAGYNIECSIESSSLSLINVCKLADKPDFPLELKSIQTRNRYPENRIDTTLVFYAALTDDSSIKKIDNGYLNQDPSQIASIYYRRFENINTQDDPVITEAPEQLPMIARISPAEDQKWFELVGTVEKSSGERFVYIKDTRTGEIKRSLDTDEHTGSENAF
jgi:hypothetical protein